MTTSHSKVNTGAMRWFQFALMFTGALLLAIDAGLLAAGGALLLVWGNNIAVVISLLGLKERFLRDNHRNP